jgi:hypothetical protein
MPANPPISFQQAIQQPANPGSGGYPYQIRASDLDKNFVFATLDMESSLIESITGTGGHPQRRLKIDAGTKANQIYIWNGSKITVLNAPPLTGTHVLGAVDGVLQWIATEEC